MNRAGAALGSPSSASGDRSAGRSDAAPAPRARAAAAARLACRIATGALLLFAAYIVVTTLYVTLAWRTSVPQSDEWYSLALYDRILREGGAIPRLFENHNEHRIFFPRLVLFSDYLFFGGRGLLDTGVIFAVQAAAVGLFAWLARRSGAGRTATWAAGGLAAALLFSLYQGENFVWPFQVQFVGVFACASLCCTAYAFGLAADRDGRRSAPLIGAGFALAFVATFSMANGVAAGVVLALLAALVRARPALLAVTAAVAAGLILLFGIGYHLPADHEGLADLLRDFPRLAAFAAGYLGNFAPDGRSSEIALGAAGIAATLALAIRTALVRDRDPVRLALLGIALFCAASALITAAGRARFGLDGVEASRYSTGAATFWAATLIHLWSLSGRTAGGLALRGTVCAAALYLLASCNQMQVVMAPGLELRAANYGALEDSLLLGLLDRPALRAFEEPVDQVVAMTPVLRRRGLSFFGERDATLFGRPLSDVEGPRAAPMACTGTLGSALAVPSLGPDGVAVAGTSSLRPRFGRLSRVYIVNAGRRIVGFARVGEVPGAWKGYAKARPGDELSAYTFSDAGRACRLGSAVVSAAAPNP